MAFNTEQFAYKDIQLNIAGEDITGFTNVKFKTTREKEYLYGKGSEPHAIQPGNKSYEGEITLWQSTYEALVAKAPNGDITLLKVDVVVMYAPELSSKLSGYRMMSVEFTEAEQGMSQGDTHELITLPIMFLGLKKVA